MRVLRYRVWWGASHKGRRPTEKLFARAKFQIPVVPEEAVASSVVPVVVSVYEVLDWLVGHLLDGLDHCLCVARVHRVRGHHTIPGHHEHRDGEAAVH